MGESHSIVKFTDLKTWQAGHSLAVTIYRVTERFPEVERYGLVSQMRRSSVSVTSNIAEGFGRRHAKEKRQFFSIAKGSLVELQNQLILARDVQLITNDTFDTVASQTITTLKLLHGLQRANNRKE